MTASNGLQIDFAEHLSNYTQYFPMFLSRNCLSPIQGLKGMGMNSDKIEQCEPNTPLGEHSVDMEELLEVVFAVVYKSSHNLCMGYYIWNVQCSMM